MSDKSNSTLQEILIDALDSRGLDIQRLAELTDIPERYLTALRDNEIKKLPAAPYIRGYLMKIGAVLEIDGKSLWELYKSQNPLKASGIEDRLPTNRFAIQPKSKKRLAFGLVIILAIIYLAWSGNDFFGAPRIEITSPVVDNLVFREPRVLLKGEINPKDKLTINSEEVIAGENGRFEKDFHLQAGVNTVEFKVKRFLGKETTIVRQVIYQP